MACLTNALGKKSPKLLHLFAGFIFILCSNTLFANNEWQTLAPGMSYRDLTGGFLSPWSHVHVFRISPKTHIFKVIMAKDFSKKLATAQEFLSKSSGLLAINGGFFDNQFHPLGLRISNFKQKNSIKAISWWGVFFIKNQKPYIKSFRDFNSSANIEFAIQSGPRLLIKGEPTSLKPGLAERTALGITKDKQVIILVTENAVMTTTQLATIMQSEPISCTDALNLDGGSSTQLYAMVNDFSRHIYGFSHVSDAVVVKTRP
jgi:uncharacterized protein YigE (DUF2233 family)